MQIYSITTLTMVMHSLTKIHTPHYYNKNCKTPTGVYMTQWQPKVTKYQRKWMLRQCHMWCTFQATLNQSPKLIISCTRQYHMMIKACFQQSWWMTLPISTSNKHPVLKKYPKTRRWYNWVSLLDWITTQIGKPSYSN